MNIISTTKIWDNKKYDTIIDVRSPSEFSEDHIPGAINLPVLDDEERKKIGIIYKKKSPFEAKVLGSSLVTKNISEYLYNFSKESDIIFQNDLRPSKPDLINVCAGFMYIKPNQTTRDFFKTDKKLQRKFRTFRSSKRIRAI